MLNKSKSRVNSPIPEPFKVVLDKEEEESDSKEDKIKLKSNLGDNSSQELSPSGHVEESSTSSLYQSKGKMTSLVDSSPKAVHSSAVIKWSQDQPTPLARLKADTNLNLPPDNWLRDTHIRGFVQPPSLHTGFSSFKMAHRFLECLPNVDVMADGENIKKLLKIPFSSNPVSLVVHRVGRTLLIDDFDIHRYLFRKSEAEWEWMKEFVSQTVLEQLERKEGALVKKDTRLTAQQERSLISKFLYRSIENSREKPATLGPDESTCRAANPAATVSLGHLPPLPDHDQRENIPDWKSAHEEKFARNHLWTFEDIRMLIGTNMPIFGDAEHPCVSLRLRDMKKPITVLTGMDYWLDNLMCQVPEMVMCYHLDGIVQKYELIKTEDLPTMEGSNFSTKVVRDIAQNILSFLKSNATKEGHTYWLFKAKNDEIVKLYDLTSLSQKDSGIKPKNLNLNLARDQEQEQEEKQENLSSSQIPFQTPVSLLLYRLARNILENEDRVEHEGTVKTLLQNCLELLDKDKFPQIATSAQYLLAELYVPEDLDPSSPVFPDEDDDSEDGQEDKKDSDSDASKDSEDSDSSRLEVQNLFVPKKRGWRDSGEPARAAPLTKSVERRCREAIKHIDIGLTFLSSFKNRQEQRENEARKEQERHERENPKMSIPNQPIPMPYDAPDAKQIVRRGRSNSEGAVQKLSRSIDKLSWYEYLKLILLKKGILVYITMAETSFNSRRFGRALKCIKRAVNCHSVVESLAAEELAGVAGILSFALGVAGDSYMACVASWGEIPLWQEQFNECFKEEESIFEKVEQYSSDYMRDWTIKCPRDIQEAMELAASCYTRGLDVIPASVSPKEKSSLTKRLANVENELGVFFMNQACGLIQQADDKDKEADMSAETAGLVTNLFEKSLNCLNRGLVRFQSIGDPANTALLLSNTGRLNRLMGHAAGTGQGDEFCGEEARYYKLAVGCYEMAIKTLANRRSAAEVWDSIVWELSSTLFTIGTLLQDHAPLSSQSREEVEKQVTDYLLKALKYCDCDSPGTRQVLYQYRAAVIHHRLASLYHHSYRCYSNDDPHPRRKKLRQLAELYYSKAASQFEQLDHVTDYLRASLEKVGIMEAHLNSLNNGPVKIKQIVSILEELLETLPVLQRLAAKQQTGDGQSLAEKKEAATAQLEDDGVEEQKLRQTLVQRLQFLLLALVKAQSVKAKKGNKEKADKATSELKEVYASSLKMSCRPGDIVELMKKLPSVMSLVR